MIRVRDAEQWLCVCVSVLVTPQCRRATSWQMWWNWLVKFSKRWYTKSKKKILFVMFMFMCWSKMVAWIGVIKCIVRKIRRKLCRSSSYVVRAQLTENGVQTDTFRAYRLLSALPKPYAVQFCFSTIFISITHTMPRQIHIMQDLLPVVIVVSCAYHIIHFRLPSIFNHCSVHWYDDNSIAVRVCVMLGIVMYPLTWRYQ